MCKICFGMVNTDAHTEVLTENSLAVHKFIFSPVTMI